MCDQQSLRSACAYAQSDQGLCKSNEYSLSVKQLIEHHLGFLSLKGGCTGSCESTLVKMLHCWKYHVTAQLCLNNKPRLTKSGDSVSGERLRASGPLFLEKRVSHKIEITYLLLLYPPWISFKS